MPLSAWCWWNSTNLSWLNDWLFVPQTVMLTDRPHSFAMSGPSSRNSFPPRFHDLLDIRTVLSYRLKKVAFPLISGTSIISRLRSRGPSICNTKRLSFINHAAKIIVDISYWRGELLIPCSCKLRHWVGPVLNNVCASPVPYKAELQWVVFV